MATLVALPGKKRALIFDQSAQCFQCIGCRKSYGFDRTVLNDPFRMVQMREGLEAAHRDCVRIKEIRDQWQGEMKPVLVKK